MKERDDSGDTGLVTSTNQACPQCLNPHTIVADQSYRGLMRFCPMCDYSWVIGQPSKDGEGKVRNGI